eukprot:scaffold5738_cov75-Skeletonema_dohrnii-CCMP3373.AAC.1
MSSPRIQLKALRGSIGFDSEDVASENFPNYEDSEDMIFSPYNGMCYENPKGGYGNKRQSLGRCCDREFNDCKFQKSHGGADENCARQQQKCIKYGLKVLDSEDVISEFEDYAGDEDLEEFDSEDLAASARNFANSEDNEDSDSEEKDSEDNNMIFNYNGKCRRYYGSNRQTLTSCCTDEFYKCKKNKKLGGIWVPNCKRQEQQCFKFGLVVEVA